MFKDFEFNGNLDDVETGVPNYTDFITTIMTVKLKFHDYFGDEIMNRYPLMIDNGTKRTGYTPVITPVWDRGLIMKLHIDNGSDMAKVVYQAAHEFTHYVFFSLAGLNKPRADFTEESYCSAASLIFIKEYTPAMFELYKNYVAQLPNKDYKEGLNVAESVNYDMLALKELIIAKAKTYQ